MPAPINISASRSGGILGVSDYQSPLSVWQDIMESVEPGFNAARGYAYEPFDGNASTRWGSAFEDAIIGLAENAQGKKIFGREQFYEYHKRFPDNRNYVTCHIDGFYEFDTNIESMRCILHEGKTTSLQAFWKMWGEPGTDRIPAYIATQVQHQLLCAGADECIVSVLVFPKSPDDWEKMGWKVSESDILRDPNPNGGINHAITILPCERWAQTLSDMGFFHQYHIKSNPAAHKVMLEVYDEFWHKNVLEKIAPEPKNYADVKRLFPEPKGVIIATDQLKRWSAEYDDITGETGKGAALNIRKDELKLLISREMCRLGSQAGHDFNSDGVEKLILMDSQGNKLRSYGKEKKGTVLR